MTEQKYNDLLNKIITYLPVVQKSDKPIIILFVAYMGMGKTTIANLLKDKLNAVVLENDKIRMILSEENLYHGKDQENLVQKLSIDRLSYFMKKENNIILDFNAFNKMGEINKYLENSTYKKIVIKLICPEEEVHKRILNRIKEYGNNPNNNSRTTEETYLKNIELYYKTQKYNEQFFTIDTTLDLNIQINKLIEKKMNKNIVEI